MSRRQGYKTKRGAQLGQTLNEQAAAFGVQLVDDDAGLMRPSAGPAMAPGFDPRYAQEDWEMMRGNPGVAPPDYQGFADAQDIAASRMPAAQAGGMAYDHGGEVGVVGATPIVDRAQGYLDARAAEHAARQGQVDAAYQYGQQYLNNPLDAKGRARMGRQFMNAPLGGHVRRGLEGQELFGHTVTGDQALMAERAIAGAMAVGIGVPTFLAGVQQLTGDQQTPGTIPMV